MTPAEIQALEALLARAKAGRQTDRQFSDSSIADDAALGEETPMCEIKGPYRDRKKWRVRIVDTVTGAQQNRIYSTEDEARAAIPKLQTEYRRPVGVPTGEALQAYQDKQQLRGRKPRTIETAVGRIRSVLTDASTITITGEVSSETATALWDAYSARPTHSKRPPSTDTQIGTLKAVRAFWGFVVARGWAKVDPWAGIEVEGQRSRGKPQLTEDQARAFRDVGKRLAGQGDEGAIAALMALYLGLRASEIAARLVGDVDANGTKLNITEAKTRAGIRRLLLPEALRPFVAGLTEGREPEDPLFPGRNRHWVLREVQRICKLAGVKRVTPHGLRGTSSSLALDSGMIGDAVAASLGHESFQVTKDHYASPTAVANAQIARVAAILN